jgi:hypothetical protein
MRHLTTLSVAKVRSVGEKRMSENWALGGRHSQRHTETCNRRIIYKSLRTVGCVQWQTVGEPGTFYDFVSRGHYVTECKVAEPSVPSNSAITCAQLIAQTFVSLVCVLNTAVNFSVAAPINTERTRYFHAVTTCVSITLLQYWILLFFHPVALRPNAGHNLIIVEFLNHIQRRPTVGRTPLDEWSARRRDLYLTTHNTHNRQTSMSPVGFEPTISAGERSQI